MIALWNQETKFQIPIAQITSSLLETQGVTIITVAVNSWNL